MQIGKPPAPPPMPRSPGHAEMLAAFQRVKKLRLVQQREISAELGIHQGQVSKILRGEFVFPRGNALRVFEYVKRRLDAGAPPPADIQSLGDELTRKLMSTWDRTPDGAKALSAILDGVSRLQHGRR